MSDGSIAATLVVILFMGYHLGRWFQKFSLRAWRIEDRRRRRAGEVIFSQGLTQVQADHNERFPYDQQ